MIAMQRKISEIGETSLHDRMNAEQSVRHLCIVLTLPLNAGEITLDVLEKALTYHRSGDISLSSLREHPMFGEDLS